MEVKVVMVQAVRAINGKIHCPWLIITLVQEIGRNVRILIKIIFKYCNGNTIKVTTN